MPKDLLVRGLSKEDTDWISSAKPVGMTQSEFLKAIIQQARSASTKLPTNKASRAKPRGSAFTFIDLFAGIGGFHLGMHSVGGQCVFSNEWDKYAARTYSEWTRSTDLSTEDIRTLITEKISLITTSCLLVFLVNRSQLREFRRRIPSEENTAFQTSRKETCSSQYATSQMPKGRQS